MVYIEERPKSTAAARQRRRRERLARGEEIIPVRIAQWVIMWLIEERLLCTWDVDSREKKREALEALLQLKSRYI